MAHRPEYRAHRRLVWLNAAFTRGDIRIRERLAEDQHGVQRAKRIHILRAIAQHHHVPPSVRSRASSPSAAMASESNRKLSRGGSKPQRVKTINPSSVR